MSCMPWAVPRSRSTSYTVLFVQQNDHRLLIVSAFNVNRSVTAPVRVQIQVPATLIDPQARWNVQMVALTDANSVHGQIKADLAQNGLLMPEYQRHPVLAYVDSMSPPGGMDFVRQNYAKYEAMMVDSLTLKPFTGSISEKTTTSGSAGDSQA